MGHGSRCALRVGALVVLLLATVLTPFQPGRAAPEAAALPWMPRFPSQALPPAAAPAALPLPQSAPGTWAWHRPVQAGPLPLVGTTAQPSLVGNTARASLPLVARPVALASTGRLRATPRSRTIARLVAYSRRIAPSCTLFIGVWVDGGANQINIRTGAVTTYGNFLQFSGSIGTVVASPAPNLICALGSGTAPLKATFTAQVTGGTVNANFPYQSTISVTILDGGPGNRSLNFVDSATGYTLSYTTFSAGPSSWVITAKLPTTVAGSQGIIPWHAHHQVRMAGGLVASVDLADGHLDLSVAGLALPERGMPLRLTHTYDSIAAQLGTVSSLGLGWRTNLHQAVSGAPGGTVTYYDESGVAWPFTYSNGTYATPPGLPWQLSTSGGSIPYTLQDILTGETILFDTNGNLVSDTDSYGNAQTLGYDADGNPNGVSVYSLRNLSLTVRNDLQTDATSPLWNNSGGSQGQHLAYSYAGFALQGITAGAGTVDAQTTRFGYTGSLLTSVITPAGHTWTLGYDSSNRVATITSPISGTVGQLGYTPAYTTAISYLTGQATVVEGQGDPGRLQTTYSLDGQGQVLVATRGQYGGVVLTRNYRYDADHDVTTSIDGNNNTTITHYQYIGSSGSYGLPTEIDYPAITPLYPGNAPASPTKYYVYDPSSHDLTEAYDNYGAVTWYTYNGHHDVATVAQLVSTSAGGGTVAFHWRGHLRTYDPIGELTSAIDGRGVTVPDTTSTNAAPSVTANGAAASYTHSSTFNYLGDQTSASTPPIATTKGGSTSTGPAITQYTYDGDGEQLTMQSANNYNAADPTANATIYGYDHLGRRNSAKQPPIPLVNPPPGRPVGIPLSTIKFDGDGNVASTENGSGTDTYYSHDPLGRTVSIQQPLSLRVQIEPRAVAQTALTVMTYTATSLVSMRDPQGNVTTYSYDAAGRETGMVNGAGQQLTYGYDSADNLTSTLVGSLGSPSSTTMRTYDALDEPTGQTTSGPNLPGALTTTYSYDLHGNLVRKQAPNNDTSFAAHDLADQLIGQELDPGAPNTQTGAHAESFAYDAAGNRIGSTDFRGGTTAMTMDGDGRQTGQTDSYTGVPTISSAAGFDPDGNLVAQTQIANGQTRSFGATLNPADWPQQATNDGLSSSTTGAGSGDLLSQTIQNEAGKVSYNIDQLGRQNGIGVVSMGSTTPLTTTLAFNNLEQMTAQGMPNGVEQDAGYDGANRLSQLTAQNTANPALLNTTYQYGYDPLGLTSSIVTTVQGAATSQVLTHDAMGRLVSVAGGASPGSWVYDGRGNLTSATGSGATKAYSYAAGNPEEVASTSAGGGPATSYGYDGNGNTTSIAGPGGLSEALAYDAQSRLVQVTLGSPITQTVALDYNAFGQRADYTVTPAGAGQPSLAEAFKYQGDQLAQVAYTGTGTGIATPYTDTYVYTQDGVPLELLRQQQGTGTATPYWYVIDGQGNVVALTDIGGNVVDSYSYDQWGKPLSAQESVPQQLRYAGYWYDNETQWYWLTVRSYDPALERFLQPDPSEFEGLFSYAYAGDNPADRIDPSGLSTAASRSRAVPVPPQSGNLLTAHNNIESNVQVGSAQWNNEISGGGARPHGGMQGDLGSSPVPSVCVDGEVCQANGRSGRYAYRFACAFLVTALCDFATAVFGALDAIGNGTCNLSGVCGDLEVLRSNANIYAKLGALADLALWFPGLDVGKILGFLGHFIIDADRFRAAAKVVSCALCFPAGTTVATPHGEQAIQTLKVGDQVLAEDPATGKVGVERVQAVIHDPASPLIEVELSDGSSIKVTAEHPFWVDQGIDFVGPGWLPAGQLQPGDQLRTADGDLVRVVGLRYHAGTADVYTLTVASDHDFFVGAARVLVHNADCIKAAQTAETQAHYLQGLLPAGSRGRVTIGVGVAEDASGGIHVLVGTSEANGYLRSGVKSAVERAGYEVAPGTGHAEEDIVNYATLHHWKVIAVGAGRPVCPACVTAIENAGGVVATVKK